MAVKKVQTIINGQTYDLALNNLTGKYETTVTAPGKSSYPLQGHYYPVVIKAVDDAGNVETADHNHVILGESLKLKVKEKVAPIIIITYPTENAVLTNNKPVIAWKVTDDDSGVNPDTIGIMIDDNQKIIGTSITKKKITSGYECSYTPATALKDGEHTIKIDAADYDGNIATQKTVTIKIDTVPPTLNITSPAEGFVTNNIKVILSGKTNDTISSPVTMAYELNGGDPVSVVVESDGSFRTEITGTSGANTIKLRACDGAGKETIITRNFEIDLEAPVIGRITLTPNPVDAGKTFVISVEVTD